MPTLYLTDSDCQVSLNSKHIEVRTTNHGDPSSVSTRLIPLCDVDRVVLAADPRIVTMPLITRFLKLDIPVTIVSGTGRLIGAFYPQRDGDVENRIRQYESLRDQEWIIMQAREIVAAKLANSRRLLQKASANHDLSSPSDFNVAMDQIDRLFVQLADAKTLDEIRGAEGAAAAAYFRALSQLFPKETPFTGRSRRPPRDPVNALMSWTYTMVLQELRSAVVGTGLDPCLGCLHAVSYGRPALALDLLEPFRPSLCDALVLRVFNLKILKPADFEPDAETGGVRLKREALKTYFLQYEQRMERLFKEPDTPQHTCFRKLLRGAAQSYAAALRSRQPMKVFWAP